MLLVGHALLLALVASAGAHGPSFGVSQVSVAPEATDTVWAVVDGWGVVWTVDGGATWRWVCEEALGADPVLSVRARGADDAGRARAWVGTRAGLRAVDESCGVSDVAGLPEGAYVAALSPNPVEPTGVLALATGPRGGVYACTDSGCAETGLVGEGMYPKSILVDDAGQVWVTTVTEGSLEATLWRASTTRAVDGPSRFWGGRGARPPSATPTPGGDGLRSAALARANDGLATWEVRARWPDGDVDPRVLDVRSERVLLWERTRAEGDTPRLVRSEDGGATWTQTLSHGTWTDAAPGLVRVGDTVLLGSAVGARTWRSTDDGRAWTDASLSLPAVRCGVVTPSLGGGADGPPLVWTCGDHLADGFDLATSADLTTWTPAACLQEAQVATCASATCATYVDLYAEAGALGGEACAGDTGGSVDAPRGCGCVSLAAGRADASGAAAALVAALATSLWGATRRAGRGRIPGRVARRAEET